MANNRSATPADVEKSIQIALDAADAAMDVTSEYAKVAQQIKRSTAKLANIEKLGRIAVILGFVSGIGAAALCIVIFLQSSSQPETLILNPDPNLVLTITQAPARKTLAVQSPTLRERG